MVDPDILFVRTLDECSSVIQNPDDYSILRSTALLRQLLLDSNRLVDVVNRDRRKRIRFRVVDGWRRLSVKKIMSMNPKMFSVADGLHPESARSSFPVVELNRDRFLSFPVIYADGEYITVADIIRHCANVSGGVHLSSPKTTKEQKLSALQSFHLLGLPLSLKQMLSILKVVIDGLEPLREEIICELNL